MLLVDLNSCLLVVFQLPPLDLGRREEYGALLWVEAGGADLVDPHIGLVLHGLEDCHLLCIPEADVALNGNG